MGIARTAVVAAGYFVEQLRRLPGVGFVLRHGGAVGGILAVGAALSFLLWASQAAPQRVGLADLVQARLSQMQTWIILSGDVTGGELLNGTYRYALTDPTVPNARMNIISEVPQPLGSQTVSGTYVGGVEPVPIGFRWIGTMRADPELAPEPGPPWVAIAFAGLALFVGLSGRLRYPAFFGEEPTQAQLVPASVAVGVQRRSSASAEPAEPGTVRIQPGEPVGLRVSRGPEQPLRLYSARASVEVGKLQTLSSSGPALRVHQPTGDTDLIFTSIADRDVTYAALAADADYRPPGRT